jgi:glycosyltransferase involved in cell wall biosynthesis
MDKIFHFPGISKILTIHYATGSHPFFLNNRSFERLRQSHDFTDQYLVNSILFNRFLFPLQTSISNYMFIWGNDFTRQTYLPYYLGNAEQVKCLPAFFYKTQTPDLEKKAASYELLKNNFLFFGSSKFIHRGLDLLIEYFSGHPELVLHVCGALDSEPAFLEAYRDKINHHNNIHIHGFVDVRSKQFDNILQQCAFYIYPSASEGSSASVITVVGNGALIPIVPQVCGIDLDDFGIELEELSLSGIDHAMAKANEITAADYAYKIRKAYSYVNTYHTRENFRAQLLSLLEQVLPNESTTH